MKDVFPDVVEKARRARPPWPMTKKGDKEGYFQIRHNGNIFHVLLSDGMDWDHASISLDKNRTLTWEEMCYVKDLFFKEDEAVIQIHPKKEDYVNFAKTTLHLWRYQGEFPLPDYIMVGPKNAEELRDILTQRNLV